MAVTAIWMALDLVMCDTESTKRKLTQGKCGIGIGMMIAVSFLLRLFTHR